MIAACVTSEQHTADVSVYKPCGHMIDDALLDAANKVCSLWVLHTFQKLRKRKRLSGLRQLTIISHVFRSDER